MRFVMILITFLQLDKLWIKPLCDTVFVFRWTSLFWKGCKIKSLETPCLLYCCCGWWAILPNIYSLWSVHFFFEDQKHQIEFDSFCQKVQMLSVKFQGPGYNELQHFSEILLVWIISWTIIYQILAWESSWHLTTSATLTSTLTGFPVKWQ